jgi:hypothetical protein
MVMELQHFLVQQFWMSGIQRQLWELSPEHLMSHLQHLPLLMQIVA